MSTSSRLALLVAAVLVAAALVYWFGVGDHDAHALLRALHRAL
jgi:hypothetical protein